MKWATLAAAALSVSLLSGCGTQQHNYQSSFQAYTAWGDSLTNGNEGYIDQGQYPQDLERDIAVPSLVINEGVGGQTSLQIGVREGGIPTQVTVIGQTIPSSGSVSVSFPAGYAPVSVSYHQVSGTILGVHGTVSMKGDGLIFTRDKSGDSVSTPDATPFLVDSTYTGGGFIPIFWEGRNDPRDPEATANNISKQVAFEQSRTKSSQSKSYLVMSVINGSFPGEAQGGNTYDYIITLNTQLAATFPGHYLDIRKVLVDNYDPSNAADVSDYNNDVPPTSLRAIQGTATLGAAIGASDTSFPLNVTAGYILPGYMLTVGTGADAENMRIASVSGDIVTVARGAGGNQEAHPAGSSAICTDLLHLNGKGYQVVADAVRDWFKQQQ